MERVLIGIDSEQASQVAVDWVIRRARFVELRIRLVTSIDMLVDDISKDQERLDQTKARIETMAGVPVETELVDHSIWSTLVEASRDADLLVIGSHRSRPIRSTLSGNLPGRLAALSSCPIVIVPDDWREHTGEIVVGIADDHLASDHALIFAAREADRRRLRLNMVHAWQVTDRAAHRRILNAASDLVHRTTPSLVPHESLVEHSVTRSLLEHLADAELVVVGTHPPQLSDLPLGTVVRYLMQHTATPVCVVPQVVAEVSA